MTAEKLFNKLNIAYKRTLNSMETWQHIDDSLKIHFDLKDKKVWISGYGAIFEWWFYFKVVEIIKIRRKELGWE